ALRQGMLGRGKDGLDTLVDLVHVSVRETELRRRSDWVSGLKLDTRFIQLLGNILKEMLGTTFSALFLVCREFVRVEELCNPFDLPTIEGTSERSLRGQCFRFFKRAIELHEHWRRSPLGFALILCSERTLKPSLTLLPLPSYDCHRLMKLLGHPSADAPNT